MSQEQTWAQLQERLRRARERQSLTGRKEKEKEGDISSRRRTVPPNPLPRLDSPQGTSHQPWSSPELRGSHFSRVPPLSSHRPPSDDTLSLDSFNSDLPGTQEPQLTQSQPASPYEIRNGTIHPTLTSPNTYVPAWDQYTGRQVNPEGREVKKRGKKYNVRMGSANLETDIQSVIHANHMKIMGIERERYQDHDSLRDGPRLVEYDNVFGGRELVRVPVQTAQVSSVVAFMQDELSARTFLEYFLTSCLQDDLVLEVALDVLTQLREERDIERQLSIPVLDAGREILEEVVHEHLVDISYIELRAASKDFWGMVSSTPSLYKPVARELLRDVVQEEIALVVPECISELVSEYFIQKDVVAGFNEICSAIISELLPDIIDEAVYEESVLSVFEELIDEEIEHVASDFMEDSFTAGRSMLPRSPEERLRDEEQVWKLADDFLLDLMLFENLMSSRVLPNQKVWSSEEYLDLFLDSLLLDQVLGLQLELVKRRNVTEECLPLKRFHEKICTNVAIDVVLDELTAHLDQDMAEVDEYEVQLDHI
ncbi:uncharacterized protein [Diadema antillarum]|uniref:uncharacterized protein n=1 Tax=Diadema antillarum TaxID=105358 RepID=UPI003A89CB11